MLADLHLHSSCSDGTLSPEALAHRCADAGLRAIAICDHDSWEANRRLARARLPDGLLWIPGTELSTAHAASGLAFHVLGYGGRPDGAFEALLAELREARQRRVHRFARALARLGIVVHADEVVARSASPGKPEVARDALGRAANRARLSADGVGDVGTFIETYLNQGRPAFVSKRKVETADAVRAIRRCGGHPVWAHPALDLRDVADDGARAALLAELLDELVGVGLEGLEADNLAHTAAERESLTAAARARGLRVTAGSDFHDPDDPATGRLLLDRDQDVDWLLD